MTETESIWSLEHEDECYDEDCLDHHISLYIDELDDADVPEKLTAVEWRRMVPQVTEFTYPRMGPLDRFLDCWGDSEYIDPDSRGTKPSEAMLEAEREFVAKVLADPACRVWSCERTGVTREIDVLEWARENEEERIVRILEARKA